MEHWQPPFGGFELRPIDLNVYKALRQRQKHTLLVEPGVFDTPLKTLVITGDFSQNEVLYPRLYPR